MVKYTQRRVIMDYQINWIRVILGFLFASLWFGFSIAPCFFR